MMQKEIVSRMDEIDGRLDALNGEIERAERVWSTLEDYVGDSGFLPVWLTAPYEEQSRLVDEYRALSRQYRQA